MFPEFLLPQPELLPPSPPFEAGCKGRGREGNSIFRIRLGNKYQKDDYNFQAVRSLAKIFKEWDVEVHLSRTLSRMVVGSQEPFQFVPTSAPHYQCSALPSNGWTVRSWPLDPTSALKQEGTYCFSGSSSHLEIELFRLMFKRLPARSVSISRLPHVLIKEQRVLEDWILFSLSKEV